MSRSLTALANAVPHEVRQAIIAKGSNDSCRLELVLRLSDCFYEKGEPDHGLVIHADPIGIRIYGSNSLDDQQVLFEGRFEAVQPGDAPRGETTMNSPGCHSLNSQAIEWGVA